MFRLLVLFILFALQAQAQQNHCGLTDPAIKQAQRGWGRGKVNYNYNCRSDSADIKHYAIELDLMNNSKSYLRGSCGIHFEPLVVGFKELTLDFLLGVDSVVFEGKRLEHRKNKEQIKVLFPDVLPANQEVFIQIYYQGIPPTGDWNGFYFSTDFAYNVGSSFDSNPLSFGRAWYPCFESFRERATYSFAIKTRAPKIAQCNGYLANRTTNGDTITSYWQLDNTIPSYLACVAVANFVVEKYTYQGIEREIPIEIAAIAADTAAVHKGFKHLNYAIGTMEKWFGGYAWNKVGYSVVPKLSGAMEHATNTTFSSGLIKDVSTAEEYMIHELAHSWFGNQITCETGEDMWINEGMATYSEGLFYEFTYGRQWMYRLALDKWAEDVLPYNTLDTFAPPLCGAIHGYVYDGKLVYNRGALIGNTLRGYLGDSLFAKGMTAVLQNFKYQPVSSTKLRDALTIYTGIDTRPFFDDWVFTGGYVDVVVDSFMHQNGSTMVHLRQRLLGRSKYYDNLPVEITFVGKNLENVTIETKLKAKAQHRLSFDVPFEPVVVLINRNRRVFLAKRTAEVAADSILENYRLPFISYFRMADIRHAWLQCDYHYVAPEGKSPAGINISAYGYWDLHWVADSTATTKARFDFSAASQSDLFKTKNNSNKAVLLYRPHPRAPWQEWKGTKLRFINREKYTGYIEVSGLKKGQYAIGGRVTG